MKLSRNSRLSSLFASFLALLLTACSSNDSGVVTYTPQSGTPSADQQQDSASAQATEPAINDNTEVIALEVDAPAYPRVHELDSGVVTIHMPQVDDWQDFESLTFWVVAEVTPANEDKTWIGSLKLAAQSDIDFDRRLVVLHDFELLESRFHDGIAPPAEVRDILLEAVTLKPRSVPLNTVLRALPEDFKVPATRPGSPAQIISEPPAIFVSTVPAALMMINGEPLRVPVENTELEFVVNTNWDLFYHTSEDYYYVLNNTVWQRTASLEAPLWQLVDDLPADFSRLPDSENWEEVREFIPASSQDDPAPIIRISMLPAELILISGAPELEEIAGTPLSWVTNTESDLFYQDGAYYYLVSGRWFMTSDLASEQWTVAEALPDSFLAIPEEHEKGYVLAAVPGSDASRVAIIEAQIPRTAMVSVDAGSGIEVVYDGEPRFVDIEGSNMRRAANTAYQVIEVEGEYYLCHNAVWFYSDRPDGPWTVTSSVPNVIYDIPASDPAHNVTYVYVEEPQSSSNVSVSIGFGYTMGYYGYYPSYWGLAYGTGWYYPPYYYRGPYGYPVYWHYPRVYGYGSWYNPTTGRYGERAVGYGPYGGMAATSVYNPNTGSYIRGEAVWDHDEIARSGYGYNPSSGTFASSNMYYDFDDNEGWRESYVERGNNWIHSETEFNDGMAQREFETSRGVTGENTLQRQEDGSITGEGTVNFQDRSAETSTRLDSEGLTVDLEGEAGRSLNADRQFGDDSTTLTTGDGRTTEVSRDRSEQGTRTDISTGSGGQASSLVTENGRTTVGKTANGDLYASRNGEVYRPDGDGSWSQYNNGSWNKSDVTTSADRSFNTADSRASSNAFSTTSGINRAGSSTTQRSTQSSNLNRQYNARQYGSQNYNSFQSGGGYNSRNMNRGGGRSGGRMGAGGFRGR